MRTDRRIQEADRGRLGWLLGGTGVLLVLVVSVWWPGCRQYPSVTSPTSLKLMQLLYSACNARDPVRLTRVQQGVELALRQGKLTPAEVTAFTEIVQLAKSGDWARAEAASFRFAQDQVGTGTMATHADHDHAPEVAKPRK